MAFSTGMVAPLPLLVRHEDAFFFFPLGQIGLVLRLELVKLASELPL